MRNHGVRGIVSWSDVILGPARRVLGQALRAFSGPCTGLLALLPVFLAASSFAAVSPTSTTLTISPGTSVSAGKVLTLQAAVVAGGTPVTRGSVTFYDGSTALAAVQLVSQGVAYPHGTANYKLVLGPGTHSLTAVYAGTNQFAGSSAPAQAVTVALASPPPTSTVIAASGSPGAYTLSGTVTTASAIAPTGQVSFLDQSNANFLLGSTPLTVASQVNGWRTLTPLTTASSTYGVVVADLNGDGIADLVTSNYGGTTISVLLGNGDGTFQPHVDYTVGALSFGLAVGDLNGDGFPDVVVASGTNTLVSVLLGNGDGTLQPAQNYDTGGVPEYVVIGDFNRDGILDLATCAGGIGSFSILLGNGDGTFSARQTFGSSVFPDGLAAADFDRDGNLDLVVSNNPANAVSVFLGRGDGTFQPSVDYPTATAPTNVVALDLDGDGIPELVVCNSVGTTISVLLGSGNGTFLGKVDYSGFNNPWDVVAADVNGDGIPDLVVSSPGSAAVEVFQGKGDGTFLSPTTTVTGSANYLLALGDWNGDGVLDLAVPDISVSKVSVSLGSIAATATLAGVSIPGGGMHNVVASYAGDANSDPSISASISLTGTPFATTTGMTATPLSGTPAQTFVFMASISPSSGSGYTAGGTVTFFDAGTALAAPVNLANGTGSLSFTGFAPGTHSITATYSGDINFTGSSPPSPTMISVMSSQTITFPALGPVNYGVPAFNLNATASSGLAVTFGIVSGPASVSGKTLTVQAAGRVVIQADQAGNAGYSPAAPVQRTLTVNPASTTLLLAASATSVGANANVTFTAGLTAPNLPAPSGTVTFFDGASQLAPVPLNSSGTATYSTTSLTPGPHSITVTYPGNPNYAASSSAPTMVTVAASQTIDFPPLNPVTYGVSPIPLQATASSGLPVSFSLVSGQATLVGSTLTLQAAGVVVIQADQAGNSTYPAASPVRRALIVNRTASAVEITSSAASIILGSNVTFTASVPSRGLRVPTGTINFLDGANHLGIIPLSGGAATVTTSALAPGPHLIEAIYSGDSNFVNSAAVVSTTVVVPGYTLTPDPASLTVKLGQVATSTISIAPVGGYQGQVTIACGGTPQIATCSLAPATVVLPGDDLPQTVQFTVKTTVISGATTGGHPTSAAAVALFSPFGLVALGIVTRRRRTQVSTSKRFPGLFAVALLVVLAGCGTARPGPFGHWTIVMTATSSAGGAPHNTDINLTIVP